MNKVPNITELLYMERKVSLESVDCLHLIVMYGAFYTEAMKTKRKTEIKYIYRRIHKKLIKLKEEVFPQNVNDLGKKARFDLVLSNIDWLSLKTVLVLFGENGIGLKTQIDEQMLNEEQRLDGKDSFSE